MTAPHRKAFSRLETDAELLKRMCNAGLRVRMDYEGVDGFAKRHGFERRIVWVDE